MSGAGPLPNPWLVPVLTVAEAAPLLRTTPRTLRRLIRQGEFPMVGSSPFRVATTEIYRRSGLPIPKRPVVRRPPKPKPRAAV